MKKLRTIVALISLTLLLYIFPVAVQTHGTPETNAGATPPLGVVRDGEKRWVWNLDYLGTVIIIEGIVMLVLFQKKTAL
ncbi:hypothetical protein G7062_02280 [Erysipelothrix sp. HDW6C]|uniref:hypothetical protein n=1 Tax=Erysipelothrix sp. HDW6C TaxID=2714930 RepID=UPI00140DBCAB|nr:hypothetical protein [Erysipelothrix sp. HDW6C]QIK69184.1 hypothetical protein G7062_02280 [Erysipelothrix sp. HDW6C]